jgi:hypothetical protein
MYSKITEGGKHTSIFLLSTPVIPSISVSSNTVFLIKTEPTYAQYYCLFIYLFSSASPRHVSATLKC